MSKLEPIISNEVRQLFALYPSGDLSPAERERVEQFVANHPAGKNLLGEYIADYDRRRQLALATSVLDDRPSLWPGIEAKLQAPKKSTRPRVLPWLSTSQLVASCLGMLALATYVESQGHVGRAARFVVGEGVPTSAHSALALAGAGEKPETLLLGLLVSEVAAQTDQAEGAGLRVHQVLNGSIAHRMGIAPGDLILRVNGDPLSSAGQLRRLVEAATGSMLLEISRDGSLYRVKFEFAPSTRPRVLPIKTDRPAIPLGIFG